MITLTREEAQQVLDCLAFSSISLADEMTKTLRARLAQPKLEPWGGVDFDIKTAPPQRQWHGLTDEEIMSLLPGAVRLPPGWSETVRAIEAKLKEKNT
jgi:hypothetical protein